MKGQKLDLVKKSIIVFSDLLCQKNYQNQIAIVTFSNEAYLSMSWTSTTLQNRHIIHDTISRLSASGSTNISNGFKEAISELNNKKERESVPYVILLSDGIDDLKREQCYNIIKSLIQGANIAFDYGLMTLGYGEDQDYILLDDIAKLKSRGLYYNIENILGAENCFLQFFEIIERTFAHIKIEIAPILPFEISSFNDEDFIKINDKLEGKLELFKLVCKKNKGQNIPEMKNFEFIHTKVDADLICQDKKIEENTNCPQLTLCSDQNKILHINPVFEEKQLTYVCNQAMNKILKFEKQGDKEQAKQLTKEMIQKLENSSLNNKKQIKELKNAFVKVHSNDSPLEKKIVEIIKDQRVMNQPVIIHIDPRNEQPPIIAQVPEIIYLDWAESQEFDIENKAQFAKNLDTLKIKLNPTSKLTQDEYKNLITQNDKVVIVLYDKPNNQRKIKLIGKLFQNQKYEQIKLCMIDQKYHNFLDRSVLGVNELSILFYDQNQLKGTIESPQAYYTHRIESKLAEYGMC